MLDTITTPDLHRPLASDTHQDHFVDCVKNALQAYFAQLDGEHPENLYNLVMAEVEPPLLKTIMLFAQNNQSKAARILGISRGTLRKKLALYGFNT